MPVTVLITGCSSGIGLCLCRMLAARGDKVYATVRTRASSATGVDLISAVEGDVTIIEGIDVAQDAVVEPLAKALAGVKLDVVIHNAGGLSATREHGKDAGKMFSEQNLASISMDRMRAVFELNALGPLRVQQALLAGDNIVKPGGKVITISTGLGSIGDNGSGGKYAYRTSKAALNMITKNFACDLKESGIAVAAIGPGTIATEFGPGNAILTQFGAKPPEQAGAGIISVIDALTIENTGQFIMVPTSGEAPREFPW